VPYYPIGQYKQPTLYRKAITGFDPTALQALVEHRWPGNVREIDHAVERAVLMAQGNIVHAVDLGLRPRDTADSVALLEEMSLEDVETFLIKKAMVRYQTVSHAARASTSRTSDDGSAPSASRMPISRDRCETA